MSRMYPRTISVHRPATSNDSGAPQLGNQGYSGEGQTTDSTGSGGEVVILTGIRCSIQGRAMNKSTIVGALPSDGPPTVWVIFIPKRLVAFGVIRDHDIVIDDLGYRYLVTTDYWNVNGYRLNTMRLEN